MIALLRLAAVAMTAILSTAGLVVVVVALLAAQWLVVAGVVILAMGLIGGTVALVKRVARSQAGSGSEN